MELSLVFGKELMAIVAGYALGCFSAGYYLVRLCTGQDIRRLGSGSTGGTNVGRVLGRPGFVVTMFVDLLKGAVALWAALHLVGLRPGGIALVMPAVVAGHIFPIQLDFRGGKGLATALGAMLVFDYRLAIVLIAFTAVLGILSKQFTLSLMVAIPIAPVIATLMGHTLAEGLALATTALLILFAHRANVLAALRGMHSQTGKSK